MATMVMTKTGLKSISALDQSVQPMVWSFLEKLSDNDESPGLKIKPLKNAADRRVRTGRVNKSYRAVLFRVDHDGQRIYHMVGVWPHDEGNEKALTSTAEEMASSVQLTFNAALGVAEVTGAETHDHAAVEKAFQMGREEGREEALTAAGRRDNPLENFSWTVDTLVEDAGITPRYAEAALQANDQAGLSAVADRMPEVQRLMLLELAMGTGIAEARRNLSLPDDQEVQQLREAEEEQQLTAGARNAPSAFSFIGSTPEEVKKAYNELSMAEWQIFLHPEQRRYVDHRGTGSFRLTGGAGTGKTVILVHRAREMHRRSPDARIMLTTYTVALGDSLRHQLKQLDHSVPQVPLGAAGVAVAGIDQVAAKVLDAATAEEKGAAQELIFGPGRNEFRRRVGGPQEVQLWKDAVLTADPQLEQSLTQEAFLGQEYLSVVLARRVKSLEEYVRVPRTGRGTRLSRSQRVELWKIFEQFRTSNLASDRLTFAEVTVLAAAILESRAELGRGHLVDHVLVDEAQDFHAGHWQLLRALAPVRGDDLFIAEDAHQRIYGQKLTLKQFGIEIRGRSRRLKLNYRTTAQNLRFAVSLLEGEKWEALEDNADDPDEVTSTLGYTSILTGPEPVIIERETVQEEYVAAAERIQYWQQRGRALEDVAVLARSKRHMQDLAQVLGSQGVPAQVLGRDSAVKEGAVQIRTMHAAKGMEFQCVLLTGVGADHLPARYALKNLPEAEQRDARQRERSLLYVAASRARDELVVTYSGAPSEFMAEASTRR